MSKKQAQKKKRLYDLEKDDVFYFPENAAIRYIVTSTTGSHGERKFYIKPLEHGGLDFWQLNAEVVFISSFKDYVSQRT